jgi:hypothetical protein
MTIKFFITLAPGAKYSMMEESLPRSETKAKTAKMIFPLSGTKLPLDRLVQFRKLRMMEKKDLGPYSQNIFLLKFMNEPN